MRPPLPAGRSARCVTSCVVPASYFLQFGVRGYTLGAQLAWGRGLVVSQQAAEQIQTASPQQVQEGAQTLSL